jgi:hypothetical protein
MALVRGRNREILDVSSIAEAAFVLAYPLVLRNQAMAAATAVAAAEPATMRAPINTLVQGRDTPDTVRLAGWLDLAAEPLVVAVPATHGRYYALWLRDAWNRVFASIGARTTGTAPHAFALTGPGRHDLHPAAASTVIEAPTRMVQLAGCVEAVGESDEHALARARNGFELVPLSVWNRERTTADPHTTTRRGEPEPAERVERMDARAFFADVARLAADNPPDLAGHAILNRLFEITAGGPPAPDVQASLERGVQRGRATVRADAQHLHEETLGRWRIRNGLDTDPPADTLVALLDADAEGRPLSGRFCYVLRFAPDASPPADGFWSLTTSAGRTGAAHSIGDLHGLVLDRDGSLPIHIQAQSPVRKRRSNWLPAPPEEFALALRLYWPRNAALRREWSPPAVTRSPTPPRGRSGQP